MIDNDYLSLRHPEPQPRPLGVVVAILLSFFETVRSFFDVAALYRALYRIRLIRRPVFVVRNVVVVLLTRFYVLNAFRRCVT